MTEVPEIFAALQKARVRYLLVGGLASVLHGVPRTTLDVDLLLPATRASVVRALRALRGLGLVPDADDPDDVLGVGGVSLSNGIQVDLITDVPGAKFADLWKRREVIVHEGVRIPLISRKDQVRLLRRVGRAKDKEDADHLSDERG